MSKKNPLIGFKCVTASKFVVKYNIFLNLYDHTAVHQITSYFVAIHYQKS